MVLLLAAGKVTVKFLISPYGLIDSATVVEDTLKTKEVAGCILTAIRQWAFRPPDGGGTVQVTFPWVFRPRD